MKPTNYNPDVLSCLANLSNDEVFTPPNIVTQMLDQLPEELWSDKNATFLDPVTKTGVFLREIALRLNAGLEKQIPDQRERANHIYTKQIFGIAITELTSLLARRSVYCSKTANGKYSVCDEFTSEQGNIIFDRTEHTWKNGKCTYCGASQSEYDREDILETYAYQFIHTDEPAKLFNNMKFDVIIGNPPYQLSDGGNGASASPLYHHFVSQAKKMNPRYLCMVIPSRWLAGGKGLDSFRVDMLNDRKILKLTDYINAKECFPGISLGGGVCYFLWDRQYDGECEFTNIINGKIFTEKRALNEFPIFVRYNNAIDIVKKVMNDNFVSLSESVSSRNPFGLSSATRGSKNTFIDSIYLYSSEGISYIKGNLVDQGHDLLTKYKVMISKVTSEHAGEPDKNGQMKIISRIQILKPKEVCTDSYLVIGNYKTRKEAENLNSYLKTRFARFLLLQAISSINLSKDKFFFIPKLNYSEEWTDEKLFKKFKISKDEISFIESLIKPMD